MFHDAHIHVQDLGTDTQRQAFLMGIRSLGIGCIFSASGASGATATRKADVLADWEILAALSRQHHFLVPFYGVHPWHVDTVSEGWLVALEARLLSGGGIGEVGLDRARKSCDLALQEKVCAAQVALACRMGRPFVVHCVRAWDQLQGILRSCNVTVPFVMHGFHSSEKILEEVIARGGYVSLSYKTLRTPSARVRATVAAVPLNRLLIETDFPYQQRFIVNRDVAEYAACLVNAYTIIAQMRKVDIKDLMDVVWNNGTVLADRAFAR